MTTLNNMSHARVAGQVSQNTWNEIHAAILLKMPDFYEEHLSRAHAIFVDGMGQKEAARMFSVTPTTIGSSCGQIAVKVRALPAGERTALMNELLMLWFERDYSHPDSDYRISRYSLLMVDPAKKRHDSVTVAVRENVSLAELRGYVIRWRERYWTFAETLTGSALSRVASAGVEVTAFWPVPLIDLVELDDEPKRIADELHAPDCDG